MPSGRLRSSGSSGRLRHQRLTGNDKNTVAGKLGNELLGVFQGLFGIDVKLLADMVANNFAKRSLAVGSLEDYGRDPVQRKETRIGSAHHHRLARQRARGNRRT